MTEPERLAYNAGIEAARGALSEARHNVTIEGVSLSIWSTVVDVLDDRMACLMEALPDDDPEARRRGFALVQG